LLREFACGSRLHLRHQRHPWQLLTADSRYSITFDVDVETPFSLSGVLSVGNPFIGTAWVTLQTGTTVLLNRSWDQIHLADAFLYSGSLQPGRYQLDAEADAGGFVRNQDLVSFDVTLLAIPEPSSALLLGIGLAVLIGARTRARRLPRDGMLGVLTALI